MWVLSLLSSHDFSLFTYLSQCKWVLFACERLRQQVEIFFSGYCCCSVLMLLGWMLGSTWSCRVNRTESEHIHQISEAKMQEVNLQLLSVLLSEHGNFNWIFDHEVKWGRELEERFGSSYKGSCHYPSKLVPLMSARTLCLHYTLMKNHKPSITTTKHPAFSLQRIINTHTQRNTRKWTGCDTPKSTHTVDDANS